MKNTEKISSYNIKGFTLVELIIALTVTAMILTSVVSLAYALGTATDAAEDISRDQARIRYATLKLSHLLKNCKLVCAVPGNDLLIWRNDDNSDNLININELVWIMTGPQRDYIKLCEFNSSTNSKKNLIDIRTINQLQQLKNNNNATETMIIPQCIGAEFLFDVTPNPPTRIKLVNLSFRLLDDDGRTQLYQIHAALRCWAGNLLDPAGSAIVSDDD